MLRVERVTKRFGGLIAVKNVSFEVKESEIVGLIGPNGAGKTTLFNLIGGVYKPDAGSITFMGRDITGMRPHKICRQGIARTFQIPRPFPEMTVLENVFFGSIFARGLAKIEARDEGMRLLEFFGMASRAEVPAANLMLSEMKSLEVTRALATKPRLLLLDEVVAGLNAVETAGMMKLIEKIRSELKVTVFWVEHVMKAIMGASDRIIVLNHGENIAEGRPDEIAADKMVVEAYLGESPA